jgi:hypothetical protein
MEVKQTLKTIVKVAFTALALAFWQLFGQQFWNSWLQSRGVNVGFTETFLGYFIVLSVAWAVSSLATRGMRES